MRLGLSSIPSHVMLDSLPSFQQWYQWTSAWQYPLAPAPWVLLSESVACICQGLPIESFSFQLFLHSTLPTNHPLTLLACLCQWWEGLCCSQGIHSKQWWSHSSHKRCARSKRIFLALPVSLVALCFSWAVGICRKNPHQYRENRTLHKLPSNRKAQVKFGKFAASPCTLWYS